MHERVAQTMIAKRGFVRKLLSPPEGSYVVVRNNQGVQKHLGGGIIQREKQTKYLPFVATRFPQVGVKLFSPEGKHTLFIGGHKSAAWWVHTFFRGL
ncbi:Putative cytosolic protein, partial [Streptococcus thermophilus CNCM I-1630]